MSREFYEAKLPVITAIPEEDVSTPNMPVKSFLEEAEFVHSWCQSDKEALIGAGLDWEIVEDLPARTGALREAETIWFGQRFYKENAIKQWEVNSDTGYDLRDTLLHTFRHAYEEEPDLLARVSSIAAGNGHADMIQDLNNLAGLGRLHSEPLSSIRFDLAELDKAAKLSSALADMLADAQVDRKENSSSRQIRDQAYTHLKQAVDKIRSKGQYVFWKNEERLDGYVSQYNRRRNAKWSGNSSQTNDSVPVPPAGENTD